jgi:hypothetical protein
VPFQCLYLVQTCTASAEACAASAVCHVHPVKRWLPTVCCMLARCSFSTSCAVLLCRCVLTRLRAAYDRGVACTFCMYDRSPPSGSCWLRCPAVQMSTVTGGCLLRLASMRSCWESAWVERWRSMTLSGCANRWVSGAGCLFPRYAMLCCAVSSTHSRPGHCAAALMGSHACNICNQLFVRGMVAKVASCVLETPFINVCVRHGVMCCRLASQTRACLKRPLSTSMTLSCGSCLAMLLSTVSRSGGADDSIPSLGGLQGGTGCGAGRVGAAVLLAALVGVCIDRRVRLSTAGVACDVALHSFTLRGVTFRWVG